ncbi:bifunctional 3-oxoadipate enol-lactonase/4-carboxymuconolactone decarboxylase PcaDC [Allostreptomyces psammosilenae]|uniref:3-oxoadipate enol-lactonase/4-carboxymuconolactone decarboxylase n=1 Tax=Allostreptomyces psammosilenae TaxID=1892865 RepID=A0A852ZS31_9ACTN|nr:3-oxoadipate enol-lactonase [Allostreptomyces psammosilenae]NYI05159.1 3-oxoadipate enol-lactonase/4-carboxymuconolactone decarboxylase [Allostreptomyces psammosilenae]
MADDPLPHHTLDGPAEGRPLVLGPSVGTSLAVWQPQVAALARTHRVLRWDLPGHGGSPAELVPLDGSARIADLAALVLRLVDAQGWRRFDYGGISLGGAVGLYLAVHHPDRLSSLTMVCSSARFGEPSAWRERADGVRREGVTPLLDFCRQRWFTPRFASSAAADALVDDLRRVDPAGYAACCDVLGGYDLRAELASVTVPTLVVAGRDDPATPPAHARRIADGVPGASLLEIPGAAHLAGVERPEALTATLLAHLAETAHPGAGPSPARGATTGTGTRAGTDTGTDTDAGRHAAGTAVRRAVLGDAHVDRAIARTTPFTARFQDFITRYAWGEIWTGSGLDRRTRSCVTLTALVARGHHEELAMHVRAALTNGLSREEIGEVLLQCAVYCGVPAANSAFAVASRVFDELDAAGSADGEAGADGTAGPTDAAG